MARSPPFKTGVCIYLQWLLIIAEIYVGSEKYEYLPTPSDFLKLLPTIPDHWGCLQVWVSVVEKLWDSQETV